MFKLLIIALSLMVVLVFSREQGRGRSKESGPKTS